MESSTRYGLRAKHGLRKRSVTEEQQAAEGPEAEAVTAVGLKPKVLTKQERQAFGGKISEYLEAR